MDKAVKKIAGAQCGSEIFLFDGRRQILIGQKWNLTEERLWFASTQSGLAGLRSKATYIIFHFSHLPYYPRHWNLPGSLALSKILKNRSKEASGKWNVPSFLSSLVGLSNMVIPCFGQKHLWTTENTRNVHVTSQWQLSAKINTHNAIIPMWCNHIHCYILGFSQFSSSSCRFTDVQGNTWRYVRSFEEGKKKKVQNTSTSTKTITLLFHSNRDDMVFIIYRNNKSSSGLPIGFNQVVKEFGWERLWKSVCAYWAGVLGWANLSVWEVKRVQSILARSLLSLTYWIPICSCY